MDKNTEFIEKKIAERTIKALSENRMEAYFAESSAEAVELVKKLIPKGSSCCIGGSRTLYETGVIDLLQNGDYDFHDGHSSNFTPEERAKEQRSAYFADYFLASANALTENGEIYEVDGAGTRVSPMIFGPKNVILVVGTNKIVPDLAAAEQRVKTLTAPANALRLNCKTPCTVTGKCADCHSPERICCDTVVFSYQRFENRIKVIIVGEHLGY